MEWYALLPSSGKIMMVLAVDITLNLEKLTLADAGESAALSATVKPDNTPVKEVTWSSSDETVATVNADGVVTAINKGQAVITAATVLPYHAGAFCNVTVGG